jgi:mono/diheme cytochrome c family protein
VPGIKKAEVRVRRREGASGEPRMKTLVTFIIGLIAAPVLFGIVAVLGWLPSDAASDPSGWESKLAMRALDASLEKRSSGLENPIETRDAAALAAGRKIYTDNCAGCHGSAQKPSAFGSGFYPRVPQFFQEGTDVDPKEAFAAVQGGIRYSGMPAWRGQLSDRQMWQVANFVAQIRAPGGKTMDMDSD